MVFRVEGPPDILDALVEAPYVSRGAAPFEAGRTRHPHETEAAIVRYRDETTEEIGRENLEDVLDKVAESNDLEEQLKRVSIHRMSNAPTQEEVFQLIEEVWGSRSPNLDDWVQRRNESQDDFQYTDDSWIAVEAATRLVLEHWSDSNSQERQRAVQVLSKAARHLDEDEYLLAP